jgi:hypothetical protein
MELSYWCPGIILIGISWGGAMVSSTARGHSSASATGTQDRVSGPTAAGLHRVVARLLANRYADGQRPPGDLTDLEAAIGHARQGLNGCDTLPDNDTALDGDGAAADGTEVVVGLRTVLGLALADRFDARVRLEPDNDHAVAAARADRDEAIAELAAVLPQADAANWPGIATTLGRLRHQRYGDRWPGAAAVPGDLDAAVGLLSQAAQSATALSASTQPATTQPTTTQPAAMRQAGPDPRIVRSLVPALWDKYALSADGADRDELISWAQVMLDLPGTGEQDALSGHDLLGLVLLDRARDSPRTRQADLSAAIGHLEEVLARTPLADPGRASLVALLADACWRRIDGQASRAEVDKMTGYAQEAWRLQRRGEPVHAELALYLAVGLHERLRHAGQPADAGGVASTIEALAQAEPLLVTEPDSHALAMVLLGHFLISRAQDAGSAANLAAADLAAADLAAADLAAARHWILRAADEVPAQDPQWSDITQTLAGSMAVIALAGLPVSHLDRAIDFLRVAARRPEPDRAALDPSTPDPSAQDRSTPDHRAPDPSTPDPSAPDRDALICNALGVALVQRAGLTGCEQDLDDGIAHLAASWQLTPEDELARIAFATRLGSALLTRFTQRGDSQDVQAAQCYLDAARVLAGQHGDLRALMADADTTLASMRGLLGLVRGLNGDRPALDESVVSLRAAMALLPPDHPHRARVRNDLGLALTVRAIHGVPQPADLAQYRARRARRTRPPTGPAAGPGAAPPAPVLRA